MSKITESARGENCQVRIPGVCNHDSSTVVLAHRNGGGMGAKHPDSMGAYACSACHAFIDGGYMQTQYTRDQADLWHYEGIFNTQEILIEKGLLVER